MSENALHFMSLPFQDRPHVISISTGTFVKAVLIAAGLAFAWFIRDILAVLFAAVLLAALIDPLAGVFARRRVPRALAVLLVYLVLIGVAAGAVLVLVPIVGSELSQLVGAIPTSPFWDVFGKFQAVTAEYGLQENVAAALRSLQSGVTSSFTSVFSTITGVFGALAAGLPVLVLAFYMVVEDESARRFFKNLAPEEYQPYLSRLFSKMQGKVGAWLRGQLTLGTVIGVTVYLGLLILDVRYALVLALLAALLELVPYVGPILSVIPAVLIAFGQSPVKALSVLVLYVVIQQLENNILVPKIMQKATGLNPIASIVALLVGVKVGGFVGALLSIPVATMAAVVLEDLFTKEPEDV